MTISASLAHKILVNSAAVGADLVRHHGVPQRKIFLSHNGVDLKAFQPRPRERLVFPEAPLIIGAVCALRPEKRIDLLVSAFAAVQKKSPELRLLIVGSGPVEGALKQQVRELDITPYCHFEPSKSNVAEWMRSIDVFVMSSESESFPNALLEAMACGCCSIGSAVGGVPELIHHEESGLLFEPKSAADLQAKLLRVIENPALRTYLAENAVRTAQNEFSIEAALHRIQGLYTSLLTAARV
jgi:glycosyltransferase involved in cell wall biosynthesis